MTKKSYYLFISFLFLAFISLAQPKKEYYDSEQTKLKSETNILKTVISPEKAHFITEKKIVLGISFMKIKH